MLLVTGTLRYRRGAAARQGNRVCMERMRTKLLAALVGTALIAGAVAATQSKRPESLPEDAPAPRPAELGTVELREVAEVYAADAVIEAVHAATVSAQIAGNVTRYYVDAGDRVKRGQLLVRIDTRETDARVAAGVAGVAQAEAQLTQAKLNYERTAQLLESKF